MREGCVGVSCKDGEIVYSVTREEWAGHGTVESLKVSLW